MIIIYKLIAIIFWLLSKLPFSALYLLSDILAFILLHIARYRKDVITNNLQNAFPDKSSFEIKEIAKVFYKNLADIILEVVKSRSISRDDLMKRVKFTNTHIINDLEEKNKSIIAAMGHCGNWELMALAFDVAFPGKGYAVVKPLSDPFFEKYVTSLRTRFSDHWPILPFKSAFKLMVKKRKEFSVNVIIGDQTPTKSEIGYWADFLNQDTPFFIGIEKISMSLDFAVVFFDIQRTKRGFYEVTISMLEENPKETKEFEITRKYINTLENAIRLNQDNWLWSHKRWKHKKDPDISKSNSD